MNHTMPVQNLSVHHPAFRTMSLSEPVLAKEDVSVSASHFFSFPFILQCRGGAWHGHVRQKGSDRLEILITGFPPVSSEDLVELYFWSPYHQGQSLVYLGKILHVSRQQRASVWSGNTKILIRYHAATNPWGLSDSLSRWTPTKPAHQCLVGHVQNPSNEGWPASVLSFPNQGRPHSPSHPPRLTSTSTLPLKEGFIHSRSLTIERHDGFLIRAYHDVASPMTHRILPSVVIAPGYGETKRDYLTLAYFFANNGFQVFRYDHTNHVGESDGAHFSTSLSSMEHDFVTVTEWVRRQWPQSPLIGVAASLAARVALKAEAHRPTLDLFVSLMGIVDVEGTVGTVHQEDVFGQYRQGLVQDSANILGFNVGRYFLKDAVEGGFSTLTATLADAQQLRTPTVLVTAGRDAWVTSAQVEVLKTALGPRHSTTLHVPDALHRLQENPSAARATYRNIIQHCWDHLGLSQGETVRDPQRAILGRQNRREKTLLVPTGEDQVGVGFWKGYLDRFQTVSQCPDYVQLLDHVFHSLGPLFPGQRWLDAGCGNGNAARYFMTALSHLREDPATTRWEALHYVGIDVIPEAIKRARQALLPLHTSHKDGATPIQPACRMAWAQVDMQHPLPFTDNHFDRIVSNLVIGYLSNPEAVLQELYRILAPGGRMVITNLKPHGDFSGIYHNLMRTASQPQQREEARSLLQNYGRIRQAEKEGRFQFFDRAEWEKILRTFTPRGANVYPTFAQQAFLLVIDKPTSAVLPYPHAAPASSSDRSLSTNATTQYQRVA